MGDKDVVATQGKDAEFPEGMALEFGERDISLAINDLGAILDMLGIDMDDDNFKGTPRRWLNYLQHYCQGYKPEDDLKVTFSSTGVDTYDNAMIVQVGIPYRAVCAHHLLPVLGTAHVGYIPRDTVVGLSKLSRLVYGISHRMPSLQEDVCDAVTDALMDHLEPLGAMCIIKAEHGCMSARGVEEASGCITTATSSIKGVFIEKADAREEFYQLIGC